MKPLIIGDIQSKYPIIQGGMGVGISLHKLAGSVAKAGGIGIISSAQIGFQKEGFRKSPLRANWEAMKEQFYKAKEIAGDGLVGFNIMVAQRNYDKVVKRACEVGADVIISGAGLPINLPDLVEGYKTKIAPIISSAKGAKVLLRHWKKHYEKTADFLVIEGPLAGGHLGFKADEIEDKIQTMDDEIVKIIDVVKGYEEEFDKKIPVIFAGGVWNRADIDHYMSLGCAGVQMATRFVTTEECDAPMDFKQEYLDATEETIMITKSPVGMPGRAVHNEFQDIIKKHDIPVEKCLSCLQQKLCDGDPHPYCISDALLKAVEHDTDHGLVFCGANAAKADKMTTVQAIFNELTAE
jgi:NAD(P)H-dependent flavin oxidoreductase YrpB (nitropropane dioxygenase family)